MLQYQWFVDLFEILSKKIFFGKKIKKNILKEFVMAQQKNEVFQLLKKNDRLDFLLYVWLC